MEHPLNQDMVFLDKEEVVLPSDHLKWERTVAFPVLKERMRDVVVEMADDAAWSLGVRHLTEERIRKHLKDNFGD